MLLVFEDEQETTGLPVGNAVAGREPGQEGVSEDALSPMHAFAQGIHRPGLKHRVGLGAGCWPPQASWAS